MLSRLPLIFALCLSGSLAFASGDGHDHDGEKDDHHVSEAEGLRILHPWAVPVDGGYQVYLEIENTSDGNMTLKGGKLEDGGTPMMVVATDINDATKSEKIGEILISAGTEMAFEPGGLYLMLEDVEAKTGDILHANIELEPVGEVEIEIEFFDAGTRSHPHAGHNH